MEIVAIWFLSMVALGNEIDKNANTIVKLEQEVVLNEKWIKDLETWNANLENQAVKQAGAHSSFYAGQQLKNVKINKTIDYLNKKIDQLKINTE